MIIPTCVQGGDHRATFSCDGGAVESILPSSKGFITGHANGTINVFEKDDREGYRRVRSLSVQGEETGTVR